ncbi:MAG TPA: hypothetical protein VFU98_10095 [Microlunatus sp.]|nr:hypothetical protein [Microlunatus sp.]
MNKISGEMVTSVVPRAVELELGAYSLNRVPLPYWTLRRPSWPCDEHLLADFDLLYDDAVRQGPAEPIDFRLEAPKAQFLCHLGDRGAVLLHGSGRDDIREFEPRSSHDVVAFGAQRGVYASSDGIWPLFFAVIDRDRYSGMLVNSCVLYGDPPTAGYFFSLERSQLASSPWRRGWVYLLPPETFVPETLRHDGSEPQHSTQYCSPDPVVPLARIAVGPQDFPFLGRVVGHDHETVLQRAQADPEGFPWLDPPGPVTSGRQAGPASGLT